MGGKKKTKSLSLDEDLIEWLGRLDNASAMMNRLGNAYRRSGLGEDVAVILRREDAVVRRESLERELELVNGDIEAIDTSLGRRGEVDDEPRRSDR